jgi:membrane protein
MTALANRIIRFVTHDMWRIPLDSLSRDRAFGLRQLRVLYLAWRGFREDNLSLRASALTFYSILSAVPVFAILFGIARGFDFEQNLQTQLFDQFPEHKDALSTIFNFANATLNETKKGWVAGIGVAILFWSVIKVLGSIEASFNDIWKIPRGRSIFRKFADYLAIVLICPLTLIVSGSLTLFLTTQVADFAARMEIIDALSPAFLLALKSVSLVLVIAMFSFLYIVMPNTRVRLKPALIGGLVAGAAFQLMQVGYVHLQIGVSRYDAVYGSFAALPLLLIWLQLSWFIVLLGAELAYAVQNVDTFDYTVENYRLSTRARRLLSLLLARNVVRSFVANQPAPSTHDLARQTGMPFGLVQRLCNDFVEAGIFARVVQSDNADPGYQPARDSNTLTVQTTIESIESLGSDTLPAAPSTEIDDLSTMLTQFESSISTHSSNKLLRDL